jgi:predicted unusual protein kinase regulating ubiquinone biosynthesis (AarF/ABC1/UbiB family)
MVYQLMTPHPLTIQLARQWQSTNTFQGIRKHSAGNATIRYYEILARWKNNYARLYARRILELAAASAAAYRLRAQMEAAIEKPSSWIDWQGQDWEETAMSTLGKTKISRFWMASRRLASLTLLCSPMLILMPLSNVSTTAKDYTWKYALWGIEQAGPTWIKLVQWATTRQDLFSPEFCQYFGKLRDDTEGHSWKATKQIMEEELGFAKDALEMETTPIGSGCIAQVYRGRLLKPTTRYPVNTKIAIKVQHPDIWDKVCLDFYLLHKATKWIEQVPRLNLEYLSLNDTIRQFRDSMLPQLDLTLEAKHLTRFNANFSNDDQVSFPEPVNDLTTHKVLVETFCEGVPVLDYTKPGTPKEEREQLAYLGLKTTLKMIFLHDFVHGDLHPGNILVSGEYPKLKMHLLDCGLVLEMGPAQHINLVKVLGAFTRKDGRLAGQLLVDLKSESQAGPEEMEVFIRGIEIICTMDDDQVSINYDYDLLEFACLAIETVCIQFLIIFISLLL